MNPKFETTTIDTRVPPIALSRSSIKVVRDSGSCDNKLRSSSASNVTNTAQLYNNIENHQATKINVGRTSSSFQDAQPKHIKLVITKQHKTHIDHFSSQDNLANMDKESLMNLVVEKNKRIQDLEKLVEDQRRLRLQDASQVEEKAARIKEWVANKLKELENQNKLLRDQNRKQKEAVEVLSTRLATLSPVTSPCKKNNNSMNSVDYIDKASPVDTLDIEKSIKTRKPQLKKSTLTVSSSSEDDNTNPSNKTNSSCFNRQRSLALQDKAQHSQSGHDSPVYDSVSIEINRKNNNHSNMSKFQDDNDSTYCESFNESIPPPPPLHQSDKWERLLYSMADQTFSSLMAQPVDDKCNESFSQPESIESSSYSDKETFACRKSSSSFKHDIISLMRPAFTTIDGDYVIDSLTNAEVDGGELQQETSPPTSYEQREMYPIMHNQVNTIRKRSTESYEEIDKPMTPNLFDSPMRSGKDSILRTQSVRKNPAPEKLYDFITADLIKRSYLIKPGALKNHSRWFVLKNFHLYSYKNESEETTKATPNIILKLGLDCHVYPLNQSSDSSFPFKITHQDKNIQLVADSAQLREEWIRMLTVAINMSDIEADTLTKNNATYEGLLSVTKLGHTKRCHATLVNHVIFFLKSFTDPSPLGYLSVKGAKIREIIDNCDYNMEEHELLKSKSNILDCSLAIYPRYSLALDPVYITLGNQQETDKWLHFLSEASGNDQSYGTEFEKTLTKLMINNSIIHKKDSIGSITKSISASSCPWKDQSVMLYCDRPIAQPLTSLPNETLRVEAIELFKSILLFTQVPIEPIAIDYHVSLIQNCLSRFLKYPELRNEFFAQLIKQCTYVVHRCSSSKSSSSNSACSSLNQRSSLASMSPSLSDCQFITDIDLLDSVTGNRAMRMEGNSLHQSQNQSFKSELSVDDIVPPSQSELLQVMQILAVVVSLNLPRGRLRCWLIDHLRKFANRTTNIGKYSSYTLKAINRTIANGPRDNVPSRTEIMSILLRNPYDHSHPHSLPVSFLDGSYIVVEADGSTTIEEFTQTMAKSIDIRHSSFSDFYLFASDPSGSRELHILEPQRKVLDVVGWWEQTFRRHNSGRYQNTKVIKLICKKRLLLRAEKDETEQERLLIVHQMNQEVVGGKIPLSYELSLELAAIMAQLTQGNYENATGTRWTRSALINMLTNYLPNKSSHQATEDGSDLEAKLVTRWQHLSGKTTQDCIRVYLTCIRRLKINSLDH